MLYCLYSTQTIEIHLDLKLYTRTAVVIVFEENQTLILLVLYLLNWENAINLAIKL